MILSRPFSAAATLFFGPLPIEWYWDRVEVFGCVTSGAANAALAITAGYMRDAARSSGDVLAKSRDLIVPSASQIFTYTAVALNVSAGPSLFGFLNAFGPYVDEDLYMGVELTTVTNFAGVVSVRLRPRAKK